MVRTAGSVREHSEVIIEGVVLLHDDDDVIDFVQITLGEGFGGASKWNEKEYCEQCCTSQAHGEPPSVPREGIDRLHRKETRQGVTLASNFDEFRVMTNGKLGIIRGK